jgi:hypothetical protein
MEYLKHVGYLLTCGGVSHLVRQHKELSHTSTFEGANRINQERSDKGVAI